MPENPYATPQAQSAQSAPPLAKAPDTITRKIAVGCIVAWLSAAISLIFAIMQFANGSVGGGILFSVDVVLIGVCAYGLHRHSRIAALLLVGYCILARLILLASGNLNGMVLGVIILLVYLSAARGTFQYHRWLQQIPSYPLAGKAPFRIERRARFENPVGQVQQLAHGGAHDLLAG
ncbi:hypothetical protein, partial [Xanthomonas sacchari]|uniref:hypothetical protein n=1 Tax=Xanthomonas sacchari TaxID=56458 RepID=UPI0022514695